MGSISIGYMEACGEEIVGEKTWYLGGMNGLRNAQRLEGLFFFESGEGVK